MNASLLLLAALLAGACLLIYIALLSRHRKAGTGKLELVGELARVEQALEPEGAVIVRGELWRARLGGAAGGRAMRGQAVRVIGTEGHFLLVEPAE